MTKENPDEKFSFQIEGKEYIISEKNGYNVCEIPVIWTDDPDTRVKIFKTAWEDIKGLLRIRFGGLAASRKTLSSH